MPNRDTDVENKRMGTEGRKGRRAEGEPGADMHPSLCIKQN